MSEEVLIVEDEEHESRLFELEFRDAGYEVRVANDADSALVAVREKRPDVVVLDINMPGKDGLELLGELLDIDRTLPVVLNTAYADYQQKYRSWSAAAYVIKGSDVSELLDTVRNVLAGKRG
ncbi:MAG: response regulator [Armatimonadetes bacterium]|nr:response regulator [Armatimonadota bacterium]